MDAERMSRLGGLVGIGIASQISGEIMQSKSSAHSFWLLVALSLGMVVIQTLTDALIAFRSAAAKTETGRNFSGWLLTLVQTLSGIETIVWTLYVSGPVLRSCPCPGSPHTEQGNGVGQWILRLYQDLFSVPRFLYFLPVWAFLFGFLSVNLSQKRELAAAEQTSAASLSARVAALEQLLAAEKSGAVVVPAARLIF